MRVCRAWSLGVAACLLWSCQAGGQPGELCLRLSAGDAYRLSQVAHQTILRRVGGKALEIVQDTRVEVLLEVRGRGPEGRNVIDARWESIELSIRSPGTTLRWDSRTTGQAGKAFEPLASLVGKRFSLSVSDRGTVEAIEGPDADLVASEAEGLFCPFPGGRVAVGDCWITERWGTADPTARGLAVRSLNRWSLAGRSRGAVTIRCVTAVEAPGSAGEPAITVHGGGSGTFQVDAATGRILSGVVDQDVTVIIPGEGGPSTIRVRRQVRTEGAAVDGRSPAQSRSR